MAGRYSHRCPTAAARFVAGALAICAAAWGLVAQGRIAAATEPAARKPGATADRFLRVERDADDNPVALESAVVRFESEAPDRKGVSVDLIGAIHIGEKAYYQALNKAFEKYDVVLYELVAPPEGRIPKGKQNSGHPVHVLQNAIKSLLALEHQLEYVDYSKANMVHADMSPEQFFQSMQDRGESFWTMLFRMLGEGISREAKNEAEGKSFDGNLVLALFDKNRALRLKQILADQFEDLESSMDALGGPQGSTIITERNKVALDGLKQQLAAGKKRIAIFYGAGHLPDMAERLEKDFRFKRTQEHWLTAWDLHEQAK